MDYVVMNRAMLIAQLYIIWSAIKLGKTKCRLNVLVIHVISLWGALVGDCLLSTVHVYLFFFTSCEPGRREQLALESARRVQA